MQSECTHSNTHTLAYTHMQNPRITRQVSDEMFRNWLMQSKFLELDAEVSGQFQARPVVCNGYT